ncbi:hypothetical protein DFP73DRAFT_323353 [Morchella snyderi]|nr:hypothetical protein DFP73DRAFT_323353 [Morchella snyderi]
MHTYTLLTCARTPPLPSFLSFLFFLALLSKARKLNTSRIGGSLPPPPAEWINLRGLFTLAQPSPALDRGGGKKIQNDWLGGGLPNRNPAPPPLSLSSST